MEKSLKSSLSVYTKRSADELILGRFLKLSGSIEGAPYLLIGDNRRAYIAASSSNSNSGSHSGNSQGSTSKSKGYIQPKSD